MTLTFEKIALGIFIIVLIGFNSFFILGQQTNDAASQEVTEAAAQSLQVQSISEAQARSIALGVAKGTVKEIEERTHNGVSYYNVEIEDGQTEIEVMIDEKNGDILRVKRETKDEDDDEVSSEELQTVIGRLTEEQAKELALEVIKDGVVIGFETEREDGRLLYEVSLRAQGDVVEVEIDAQTGEVVEIEWGED